MNWYYVDRTKKEVFIYAAPLVETNLEFLGSTDNKWKIMAAQAFLKNEQGFKIHFP